MKMYRIQCCLVLVVTLTNLRASHENYMKELSSKTAASRINQAICNSLNAKEKTQSHHDYAQKEALSMQAIAQKQNVLEKEDHIDRLTAFLPPAFAAKIRKDMELKNSLQVQSHAKNMMSSVLDANSPIRPTAVNTKEDDDLYDMCTTTPQVIADMTQILNEKKVAINTLKKIHWTSNSLKASTLGIVTGTISMNSQKTMRSGTAEDLPTRFAPIDPAMIATIVERGGKPILIGGIGLLALYTIERWIAGKYIAELDAVKRIHKIKEDELKRRMERLAESIVEAKKAMDSATGNIVELRNGYEAMKQMLHEQIIPKIELIILQVAEFKEDVSPTENNGTLQERLENLRVEIESQPDELVHHSTNPFKKKPGSKTTPSPKHHNPLHGIMKFVTHHTSPSGTSENHKQNSKPGSKTK